MSFSDLKNLYKQVILDHSKHPRNNGDIENSYKLEMLNPSCGDKITVSVKLVDDIIDDIKFSGIGCSISMASASMLTEELKGLSVQKANEKIHDFLNMIMGTEFNEENLEDSIALQNISQLPARVKCATLAWKITEKILEDSKK
ncbi:Fe-S cluster assembly sulfur transfer protein SufU [Gemella morbillorum]|uniref:Fe-S cluster assembly sulfur transfer protein SufU n=1 Tax=Gemella morbillorum TaxID=29391 RepID=UPI00254A4B75|nr:SUF system NifU family Fe-S cluster assembly protein [Gemella morbillorum]MDK8240333.1 SUF system NifU family Fe-S cluster assembly protein [Gemella morbillorum]MDK8255217.1 SUF system NifU family Fe-S cluster assembly protein [Gemella morbillorum]